MSSETIIAEKGYAMPILVGKQKKNIPGDTFTQVMVMGL